MATYMNFEENANDDSGIMTGAKQTNMSDTEMSKYALFLGGTNVTHDVLAQYDPLKTGYGRLFMVRKPLWVDISVPHAMKMFKHIVEYGNTRVSGLADIEVNFEELKGGYTGKSFAIPTYASDSTNQFSVTVYEFSGSPVRNLLYTWINGTTDLMTGLTHYNGVDRKIPRIQSNQTAEFIYVNTDNTGEQVEYACLLANCFPVNVNIDPFNYESGTHSLVETEIQFRAIKYESIQINAVAQELINRYKILANSLNFYSGINKDTMNKLNLTGIKYDQTNNQVEEGGSYTATDTSLLKPEKLDNWGFGNNNPYPDPKNQ
jgi:hypothetical protein